MTEREKNAIMEGFKVQAERDAFVVSADRMAKAIADLETALNERVGGSVTPIVEAIFRATTARKIYQALRGES